MTTTSGKPVELVCQELVELVTEYLSHALTPEDRIRFEKHLFTCPPCTTYLAQMRATLALAGSLSDGGPAPDGEQERRLLGLFRSWVGK
jgi:anti-sigma factor RsiW